jgi:hypothetical protein
MFFVEGLHPTGRWDFIFLGEPGEGSDSLLDLVGGVIFLGDPCFVILPTVRPHCRNPRLKVLDSTADDQ